MSNKISAGYSLVDFAGDFDNLFAHLFLVAGGQMGNRGIGVQTVVNTYLYSDTYRRHRQILVY